MNLSQLKAKLSQQSPANLLASKQLLFENYEFLLTTVSGQDHENIVKEFNLAKKVIAEVSCDIVNNLLDNN